MCVESGKWYFEVVLDALTTNDNDVHVGVIDAANHSLVDRTSYPGFTEYGWGVTGVSSTSVVRTYHAASGTDLTSTHDFVATDVYMVALDVDNSKLWFGVNGTWFDSGDPGAWFGVNGTWFDSGDPGAGTGAQYTDIDAAAYAPVCSTNGSSTQLSGQFNEDDLSYTPPTGFKTFQTKNLSDVNDASIPKGSDYFDVLTYTGDDTAARALNTFDFAPDLCWFKTRTGANAHMIFDTARGTTVRLRSDTSAVEATETSTQVDSFDADGITITHDAAEADLNASAHTYVLWCWKEAVKAGFDIVGYTGTGVAKAESHNLGVAPDVMIVKNRTAAHEWGIYMSQYLSSTSVPITDPETDFLLLDTTAARADDVNFWNDVAPDASEFTVGISDNTNDNTESFIAYLWANIAGFSRQGTYVGNGNANGPFVWTGFRVRWLLIKRVDAVNSWVVWDSERSPHNPVNDFLLPDTAAAEASTVDIDFLSNGFKCRSTAAGSNAASAEYNFLAFAEHPFKYARAF
jgi:hypothetical protein